MKTYISAIAYLISLTACATTQQCNPVTVKVPVSVNCVKSVPDRPAWAIDDLSDNPTDFEKIQAVTIDWAQQRQYINGLEAVIEGCR